MTDGERNASDDWIAAVRAGRPPLRNRAVPPEAEPRTTADLLKQTEKPAAWDGGKRPVDDFVHKECRAGWSL